LDTPSYVTGLEAESLSAYVAHTVNWQCVPNIHVWSECTSPTVSNRRTDIKRLKRHLCLF